ncbi:MAG: transporter [Cyclobacteriaceae bacterium]
MKHLAIIGGFLLLITINDSYAQGCVAIRGMACGGANVNLMKGEFLVQPNFRYFRSFRHFRGDHEEKNRIEDGTQVINDSYFLDFNLNYGITDRLYASINVPIVWHNRSSMYEHGGNPPNGLGERHSTSSQGLGDVRIGMGYWLVDPAALKNYNYALGLGVKLPTGKYDYTDTFYNQGPDRDEDIEAVVDQSIQPGDGGTGVTLDFQGFHSLSEKFVILTNFQYLFNLTETNGVLTRNGSSEFSSPDQFALRTGVMYNTRVPGLATFLGGRLEGVPSDDAFGGSEGYRRPGYVISIEPALTYNLNSFSVNVGVPIAIKRERIRSFQDKQRLAQTGVYAHGDAAFADYLINVSVAFRFGGKHAMEPEYTNE